MPLQAGCQLGPWACEVSLEKTGRNQQVCDRRVCTGWAECATEVSAQHSPLPAVKEGLGGRSGLGTSWAAPWLLKSKSKAVFHYSLWTALPIWIRSLDHFLGKPFLHSHFVCIWKQCNGKHGQGHSGLTSHPQIRSLAQSCPTRCDPMNRSTPGLPVHHQLPEFTETHVYWVSDAIQTSHPLSSPSPLVPNPSQHQSLFHWVNSSHEVAKVLEFQL